MFQLRQWTGRRFDRWYARQSCWNFLEGYYSGSDYDVCDMASLFGQKDDLVLLGPPPTYRRCPPLLRPETYYNCYLKLIDTRVFLLSIITLIVMSIFRFCLYYHYLFSYFFFFSFTSAYIILYIYFFL